MKPLYLLALVVLTLSCTKPIGKIEPNIYLDYSGRKGVFICCEGNFMYGNASLSFYDRDRKTCDNQIFFNTNNFPIGDVLQSAKINGNELYLSVNNSGKIYVVDQNNMVYKHTIKGLVSPRYIEFIDETKAYVTDLYSPSIAVLDTRSFEVTKGIEIGYSPTGKPIGTEEMVRFGDYVFTCSWSFGNKIYKIDTRTDELVDSLTVTKQPNSLVLDPNGKLWVLSDGSYVGSPIGKVPAALTRIDAATFRTEETFTFSDDKISPSRLRIYGNDLFFVYGKVVIGNIETSERFGVYRMNISATALPQTPFIEAGKRLIYGLGIDPSNGDIYFADAIDYVQKGIVYRYDKTGALIDSFKVGITPNHFCFK